MAFSAARRVPRLILTVAVVVVILVVGALIVANIVRFETPTPFETTQEERPNTVVLAELRDRNRFVAASGRYQTILDIETDVDWVPGFLAGSRQIFVAEGDVDGWVDFSGLTDDSVTVSPDGDTITVHVPPAQLGETRLDPDYTRLVANERGIIDRVDGAISGGDPAQQQALYQRASEKIGEAAARSELAERTEENTATFLRSLFESVGYQTVNVVFDGPTAEQR